MQKEHLIKFNIHSEWKLSKLGIQKTHYNIIKSVHDKSMGNIVQFSCSVVSDSLWPHGPQCARPPCPSPTPSLNRLMSIESVMPPNRFILCHPFLLLPSNFPNIRVFSNESALCIRWPKYWSFSFSISSSNEHPGLIFFRMDWLDLLAV